MQLSFSRTTCAVAVCDEQTKIIDFLVKDGKADVNMQVQNGNYGSALAAAAYRGDRGIIQWLIDAKANVHQCLRFGRYSSPLATAAYKGWRECVRILIEAGAQANLELENGLYGRCILGHHRLGEEEKR